ncbi:MAG: alpha/beta fold hydrolase [Beijerinckiaceae bacterium]|nr:alpha/beta fold hydrolase [Beijerinckiaceae bacterium]MCZ8300873.1 alpha/beta fold hydrolase [Beijerinckiaceae bacterium]
MDTVSTSRRPAASAVRLWLRRGLFTLLALAAGAYLAAAAYMAINQRNFLYRPAPGWIAPADHGLPQAERLEIRASDGTLLSGWFVPPKRPDALTYLYFHGNANGLQRRATRFGLMTSTGDGLLAMSYRGYGGSEGQPTEANLHADAALILTELGKRVPADRIVLFGESLGSGVALNLARQRPVRGVILDSPYLSVLARGQAAYPWLPVSWLLVDQFRSDLWIREVRVPILILHGTEDRLIPPSDSEALAALGRPGGVTRKLYPGQRHVVPLDRGPWPDMSEFLAPLR